MLPRARPPADGEKPQRQGSGFGERARVTILGHMRLDPLTLALLLCLQLTALALALTAITGWQRSSAMRWGLAGIWTQLGGWFAVLSIPWVGHPGSAAAYALTIASFACVLQGVQGWLGPRPLLRLAWILAPLAPLLVLLGPDAGWARRGVPDLLVSLSLALLATGLLWPSSGQWHGGSAGAGCWRCRSRCWVC
jgi:hypothetical protein